MDNRQALIVVCRVTQATGTGGRDAAKAMAADRPGAHQKTVGADMGYVTKGFVAEMRCIGVTPHVAQNTARTGGSAIDGRTIRHEGYAKSINARRGIEKVYELRSTASTAGPNSGAVCASSNCAAPKRLARCLACM